MDETCKALVDINKETSKENRFKNKLIVLLLIFLFLEPVAFFTGFLIYESQFVVLDTVTTEESETKDVEISTEGDNANAEYNDVNGDQYNDDATHNEGGVE